MMMVERKPKMKREISLSLEPLLLKRPYKVVVGTANAELENNCNRQENGKLAKAIALGVKIGIGIVTAGVIILLLYNFLPPFLTFIYTSIIQAPSAPTTVNGIKYPISTNDCDDEDQQYHEQFDNPAENLFVTEIQKIVRQFEHFEKSFKRVWSGEFERWLRFKQFEKNLKEIKRMNAAARRANRNVTYGINGMTDWSDEEMKQMLLPLDHFKKRRETAKFIKKMNITKLSVDEIKEYPSHFDWRDKGVVTPVKAQGLCGSCWAFAAVATTESAYAVAYGKLKSLSEQELLDCNLENNACNGGDEDKAFNFIHERGLVSEWEYPYVAQRQNSCRMNEKSDNLTKIDVAVFINPDEDSMLDWLINFGPVNVGIAVPPDMKPYKSGIYHPDDFECKYRVLGLHALLVVGYGVSDDGVKYWIVKNSWGDTWGQENGYVNFIRGVNACGIEDEPIGLLA